MSSFFAAPRKRKRRSEGNEKRRIIDKRRAGSSVVTKKVTRDESISGSDTDASRTDDPGIDGDNSSSDEEETAGDRRLRLAEQYLENIRGDIQETVGFDAEDIDRDLIAERLQKDVKSSKGQLHEHVAKQLDFVQARSTRFRFKTQSCTGIASCQPYVYTVSKDSCLIKWLVPRSQTTQRKNTTRPEKLCQIRLSNVKPQEGHKGPMLCVAASSDGKFVVTGGIDKRLIVYNAEDLSIIKVFTQHRDAVVSVSFRHGTNQLFSASKDRTIKVWSLDELAYVETLFGHQDEVLDVAAFPWAERCVSVGSRDRTARVWKVVEETQLVFRGGSNEGKLARHQPGMNPGLHKEYAEQSIERVSIVDHETFVTGSANGTISLWSLNKKKPVFSVPVAHGMAPQLPASEATAEQHPGKDFKPPERTPRWITALTTDALSDLVLSGSYDGSVRAWQVSENKRSLEAVGELSYASQDSCAGIINDLSIVHPPQKGSPLYVVAAIGDEPRLGRWMKLPCRSGAILWEIARSR